MKYLIVMMLVMGCNPVDKKPNVTVLPNGLKLIEYCVNGFVYYYSTGHRDVFAPKYTEDGIESCK